MSKCVLDSSALLSYLSNEEGAAKVEALLLASTCMSTANWAEVLSKASDLGKNVEELSALFEDRGLIGGTTELFPLTIEDAKKTAHLRSLTKALGLSLGDRACLALAIRLGLPVVTADRAWSKLKLPVEIRTI